MQNIMKSQDIKPSLASKNEVVHATELQEGLTKKLLRDIQAVSAQSKQKPDEKKVHSEKKI